ncbi:hypothetical protein GCM10027605_21140 [Micromonospora zhanjiangensis]
MKAASPSGPHQVSVPVPTVNATASASPDGELTGGSAVTNTTSWVMPTSRTVPGNGRLRVVRHNGAASGSR